MFRIIVTMNNIIKFPKNPKPYQGVCSDCEEVIIKKKKLEEMAREIVEFRFFKKMSLWNRIFNWPF